MDWQEVVMTATRIGMIWGFLEVARALRQMCQSQLGGESKQILGSLKKVKRQFERIETRITKAQGRAHDGKTRKEEESAEAIH